MAEEGKWWSLLEKMKFKTWITHRENLTNPLNRWQNWMWRCLKVKGYEVLEEKCTFLQIWSIWGCGFSTPTYGFCGWSKLEPIHMGMWKIHTPKWILWITRKPGKPPTWGCEKLTPPCVLIILSQKLIKICRKHWKLMVKIQKFETKWKDG